MVPWVVFGYIFGNWPRPAAPVSNQGGKSSFLTCHNDRVFLQSPAACQLNIRVTVAWARGLYGKVLQSACGTFIPQSKTKLHVTVVLADDLTMTGTEEIPLRCRISDDCDIRVP